MNRITQYYKASFNGLSGTVWALGLMMFINRLGTLILPFLTLYTTQELDWSKSQAGISIGFYGVGGLLGALVGGWLVDRFGVYRVMFFSLISSGMAYLSLQFLTNYYVFTTWLFITALLADILRPAVMTSVSHVTDQHTRTRGISLMRMAFNLGFAIGPAVGGLLIAWSDYYWIFIIDGGTCLLASVFLWKYLSKLKKYKHAYSEKKSMANGGRSVFTDGPFMMLMICSIVMLVSFFQLLFTLPLYLKEVMLFNEGMVGYFFAINGAMVFIFEMPLVHTVETKWKLFPAMTVGSLMIGLALIGLLLPLQAIILLSIYMLLVSIGEIISFPFITSTAIRRAKPENIGTYMGITSMMFSVAFIVAPIIGTQLIESFGYDTSWLFLGILGILGGLGFIYVRVLFEQKSVKN